ncbi:hypothetical protein K491DRAFT_683127 [Lophiostoma macrostomum CBS 122681]|uniref:Uncharacterized protein n=1 Tax=Lophiostoma macrostomum CBS 122681 TaxID=1314788 RepID=A0A6A6SRF9_9PLEO|nr:hypothetical protein K491DRAFT_683127 [Lophiostoma macrostomum CBS 122681]
MSPTNNGDARGNGFAVGGLWVGPSGRPEPVFWGNAGQGSDPSDHPLPLQPEQQAATIAASQAEDDPSQSDDNAPDPPQREQQPTRPHPVERSGGNLGLEECPQLANNLFRELAVLEAAIQLTLTNETLNRETMNIMHCKITRILAELGVDNVTAARELLASKEREERLKGLSLDSEDEEFFAHRRRNLVVLRREVAAHDDKVSRLEDAVTKKATAAKASEDERIAWLKKIEEQAKEVQKLAQNRPSPASPPREDEERAPKLPAAYGRLGPGWLWLVHGFWRLWLIIDEYVADRRTQFAWLLDMVMCPDIT